MHCRPEALKWAFWQPVKTQMKCRIMRHFIRVCTVSRTNRPSEKEIQYFMVIITCDPSIYTMDHPDLWPFLRPDMEVIPNPKMAFIFPISCISAFIFPILIKYFPKCEGKGSFLKSQIKSLLIVSSFMENSTGLKGVNYQNASLFYASDSSRCFMGVYC